ncbi:MAG: hypothetical protein ABEJ77_04740 [Halanaeroarchaeum sp.]
MGDDERGRERQARDADRRQRERAIVAELERGDEPELPVAPADLADLESALEDLSFPVTGSDLVADIGDREIASAGGQYRLEELLPETERETFDSPAAVRVQVQRPRVASAMKRVVEAAATLGDPPIWAQRRAYEKTFRELAAVDPEDDDEGIRAIADWIVERVREDGTIPSSRAVRREAARFCRANGHRVRDDEWLGV